MLPQFAPTTLLPNSAHHLLSLSSKSLFLATKSGHVSVLDLSSVCDQPVFKWESAPQETALGYVMDLVGSAADTKKIANEKAYLIRKHENSSWIETVDQHRRHAWALSLSPTALAMQTGRSGYLVIGTSTGEMYTSDGENIQLHGRLDLDEAEAVIMIRMKKDRLAACVTQNGKAYLAMLRDAPPMIGSLRLHLAQDQIASCISLSPDLPLVAVGRRDAPRISLFTFQLEHKVVRTQWTRELVLFGPTRVEEESLLNSIQEVQFGTGSNVAALCHGLQEPVFWNGHSGTRTGGGALQPSTQHSSLLFDGGFSFFYLQDSYLFRQSMVKLYPALHRHPSRLVLVGERSVALMRTDESGWSRIDLPDGYMKHAPIKTIALDLDKRLAVAGTKGFCVYFSNTRKWRLFQNISSEEALVCVGLVWLPNKGGFLCCATDELQWKVFDVREKIGSAKELGDLVSTPLAVDFSGDDCMLSLFSSGVEVYSVGLEGDLTRLKFIHRHPVLVGAGVHLVALASKKQTPLPRCLILDAGGRLAMADLESESWLACRGGVGDVWAVQDVAAGTVVWMVIDGGLGVWSPSLDPFAEAAVGVADVALDLNFTPVGPSRVDGAVVSFDSRVGPVGARVTCTTSPCLHGLLLWLLRTRRDGLARRVLAIRSQTRLVQAALEDLLQAVLVVNEANQVTRVVALLGCVPFPTLASIIAHCARQIDPGLWDVLFSVVGAPLDLFDQCLITYDSGSAGSQGLLRTASELLPILDDSSVDEIEGPWSRAKRVLDRTENDPQLAEEVNEYCRKRNLNVTMMMNGNHVNDDGNFRQNDNIVSRVIDFFG